METLDKPLFSNSNFKITEKLKLDINTWMWMAKTTDGEIGQ